jgi:hypothetical protein
MSAFMTRPPRIQRHVRVHSGAAIRVVDLERGLLDQSSQLRTASDERGGVFKFATANLRALGEPEHLWRLVTGAQSHWTILKFR